MTDECKILVADPDSESLKVVVDTLKSNGYQVFTAADGLDALDRFADNKPNLVILSAMLPKLHGFQVCKRMKKMESGKNTPVFITSGSYKSSLYKYQAIKEFHADEFLMKPYDIDVLLEKIKANLSSSSGTTLPSNLSDIGSLAGGRKGGKSPQQEAGIENLLEKTLASLMDFDELDLSSKSSGESPLLSSNLEDTLVDLMQINKDSDAGSEADNALESQHKKKSSEPEKVVKPTPSPRKLPEQERMKKDNEEEKKEEKKAKSDEHKASGLSSSKSLKAKRKGLHQVDEDEIDRIIDEAIIFEAEDDDQEDDFFARRGAKSAPPADPEEDEMASSEQDEHREPVTEEPRVKEEKLFAHLEDDDEDEFVLKAARRIDMDDSESEESEDDFLVQAALGVSGGASEDADAVESLKQEETPPEPPVFKEPPEPEKEESGLFSMLGPDTGEVLPDAGDPDFFKDSRLPPSEKPKPLDASPERADDSTESVEDLSSGEHGEISIPSQQDESFDDVSDEELLSIVSQKLMEEDAALIEDTGKQTSESAHEAEAEEEDPSALMDVSDEVQEDADFMAAIANIDHDGVLDTEDTESEVEYEDEYEDEYDEEDEYGMAFGKYILIEKIATGGMAEIFKAKQRGVEGFEKLVVIKRILPHLSDNKDFVSMFIDEGKIAAQLTHQNIAQIYELGEERGYYYIAMEYVQGKDLRSTLQRSREQDQPISIEHAVLVISKLCSGLDYAHRKKDFENRDLHIVHRDISPQNVLISYEGEVKIIDFGIAKAAAKDHHTRAGALKGKILYMSPEQAWGRQIDKRSDIFSLGTLLYEMLTQKRLFLAPSEIQILQKVREAKLVPPSEIRSDIAPQLDDIIMKALAKDPELRYQAAGEMQRDLDIFLYSRELKRSSFDLSTYMHLLFKDDIQGELPDSEERIQEMEAMQMYNQEQSHKPVVEEVPLEDVEEDTVATRADPSMASSGDDEWDDTDIKHLLEEAEQGFSIGKLITNPLFIIIALAIIALFIYFFFVLPPDPVIKTNDSAGLLIPAASESIVASASSYLHNVLT